MPVSGTLRWGIASAGLICHDFTTAMGTHPPGEHQVVAVAARKLEDAEKFASKHSIPKAYGGYKELAQDAAVDVVYIGTINTTHLELAKMYIKAGKHVLCEKPMCMNTRETKELVDLARTQGVFLMEAVWSRCLPSYQAIREILAAGEIGEVKQVEASFGEVATAPRLHSKELGGGTVYDLGIYTIQARIIGTKGTILVPFPFWTADKLVTPRGEQQFPLPTGETHPYNFTNSANMAFESAHVRECILSGKTESPLVSLDETITFAKIIEETRRQIGVTFAMS